MKRVEYLTVEGDWFRSQHAPSEWETIKKGGWGVSATPYRIIDENEVVEREWHPATGSEIVHALQTESLPETPEYVRGWNAALDALKTALTEVEGK